MVKQDVHAVWKAPQERGIEDIPEGTVIDVLDKFYNYCINGYYYRAKIPQNEAPQNEAVYYFLPSDVEVRGKIKEVKAR